MNEQAQGGSGEITREYTVWCSVCNEWYQDAAGSMARAMREFKRLGWGKVKNKWVCPAHIKKSAHA